MKKYYLNLSKTSSSKLHNSSTRTPLVPEITIDITLITICKHTIILDEKVKQEGKILNNNKQFCM